MHKAADSFERLKKRTWAWLCLEPSGAGAMVASCVERGRRISLPAEVAGAGGICPFGGDHGWIRDGPGRGPHYQDVRCGTLGSTNKFTEINASVACAQTAIEQIEPTPLYKPWSNSDQDIDDFFRHPGHVPGELQCPGHRYRGLSLVQPYVIGKHFPANGLTSLAFSS